MSQHVLAIRQALQVPHQQPDNPERAIDVKHVLVALCAQPAVGNALYIQQVAAVHADFGYLQKGSRLVVYARYCKTVAALYLCSYMM